LLRNPAALEALLADRLALANERLASAGAAERASLDEHLALLRRLTPRLLPMVTDTGAYLDGALRAGRRVLLEGAQGALLDVDHGTYPFVTSSNTTSGGAAVGAGIGPTAIDGVLGVVKAYTTRVGNGPLPTVAPPDLEARLRELGHEFGAVTGRPRRCGWFDAVVVRYAARVNGLTALAVTKLDVLDGFDRIPVGVAYELDGERTREMPSEVSCLERVRPVLETMEGWGASTAATRSLADLPRAARAYLDRLQSLADTVVRYVSVGTRRDQIIEV
jgi:adenylosuccinate synthase